MGPLRRDDRRSTRPLALHALLPSWIILRVGRRGARGHSATPSRKRWAIPSSQWPNAIDDASIDRQGRDRDDVSYYFRHLLRLAWSAAANLLLISLAIGNLLLGIWNFEREARITPWFRAPKEYFRPDSLNPTQSRFELNRLT